MRQIAAQIFRYLRNACIAVIIVATAGLVALAGGAERFASDASSYQASLLVVLMVSIVNPVFEEVFVVGYVIKALEGRYGAAFDGSLIRWACMKGEMPK